ncbi:MAG TPA: lysophospholipid acyltransferase family protein [Syntrophales bacterium]|nr:lysophospholipid acyltransferase family protein [Syntrophales bacterium]
MSLKFKSIFITKLFHSFLYRVIHFYSLSFIMKIENERTWLDYFRSGGRILLCTWHQHFFAAIRHFQDYRDFKPALMISKSFDGELIAGVAEKSGWHAVRGSSSRGGKEALRNMINHLNQTRLAAHIVDGPKGPAGTVKAGVIQLAHAADAAIIPFYVSADRAWYFNSWDSFFIPKPFARVVISFGEMIKFTPAENSAVFESQRLYLEKIMRPELRIDPDKKSVSSPPVHE